MTYASRFSKKMTTTEESFYGGLFFYKEKMTFSISKKPVKVKSSYFIQLSFILLPGAFMNKMIYVQQSANVMYNH